MIGIVGGGLTGLALARELAARGGSFVVLEAEERPGGVVHSGRVEGRVVEWGPQRARLTGGFAALVEALGLADDLILAPPGLPLYVYADGALREVPFSVGAFLATDLLSWPAKLRLALEPLTGAPRPDERVADLFARKVGRQAYERLIGPLYGGLYGSDPADMVVGLSLGHVLEELGVGRSLVASLLRRGGTIAVPPACSFEEGLQTLTDALHDGVRGSVRLGAPVRAIAPAGGGWRIELDGESVAVRRVVLTCPAPAAAAILEGAAPEAAGRIRRLVYNPLGVVHLHAETDLRGLGYQVALAEPLATRGVTWNDALFGRDGVYTAYLGGSANPAVVEEPDDRLGAIAADEFERVTGYPARVLAVGRETMPAWDVSWEAIRGLELPAGIEIAANWESRPGIPGRLARAARLAEELARKP